MRTWGMMIMMGAACGAALAAPVCTARANPPNPTLSAPNDAPDREIAQLIDRTEIQVAEGRVWAPVGDNALETLRHILQLVPKAAPEAVAEVNAMPHRLRERAAIEDAAGRSVEARRFMLFADALAPGGAGQTLASRAGVARPGDGFSAAPTSEASPVPAVTSPSPSVAAPVPEAAVVPTAAPPIMPIAAPPPAPVTAPPPTPVAALPPTPAPVPAPASPASAPPTEALPPALVAVLVRRGEAMLAVGDISAARLLYQRAALAGSAEATAAVARTYDPEVLARLGTSGIRPDPETAAIWYRRAIALGDTGSAKRLRLLEANGAR